MARVLDGAGVGDPHAARIAALLTSELVTNAVRHGDGPVVLDVLLVDGSLEVSAFDRAAALPVLRHPGPADPGGRGVALIDSLAAAWGVRQGDEGKAVWFRLDLPATPGA